MICRDDRTLLPARPARGARLRGERVHCAGGGWEPSPQRVQRVVNQRQHRRGVVLTFAIGMGAEMTTRKRQRVVYRRLPSRYRYPGRSEPIMGGKPAS